MFASRQQALLPELMDDPALPPVRCHSKKLRSAGATPICRFITSFRWKARRSSASCDGSHAMVSPWSIRGARYGPSFCSGSPAHYSDWDG